ncbi:MAG: hypothetical protein Q9208_003207 [Pyrenodesmia sp. 3 TL-2023]
MSKLIDKTTAQRPLRLGPIDTGEPSFRETFAEILSLDDCQVIITRGDEGQMKPVRCLLQLMSSLIDPQGYVPLGKSINMMHAESGVSQVPRDEQGKPAHGHTPAGRILPGSPPDALLSLQERWRYTRLIESHKDPCWRRVNMMLSAADCFSYWSAARGLLDLEPSNQDRMYVEEIIEETVDRLGSRRGRGISAASILKKGLAPNYLVPLRNRGPLPRECGPLAAAIKASRLEQACRDSPHGLVGLLASFPVTHSPPSPGLGPSVAPPRRPTTPTQPQGLPTPPSTESRVRQSTGPANNTFSVPDDPSEDDDDDICCGASDEDLGPIPTLTRITKPVNPLDPTSRTRNRVASPVSEVDDGSAQGAIEHEAVGEAIMSPHWSFPPSVTGHISVPVTVQDKHAWGARSTSHHRMMLEAFARQYGIDWEMFKAIGWKEQMAKLDRLKGRLSFEWRNALKVSIAQLPERERSDAQAGQKGRPVEALPSPSSGPTIGAAGRRKHPFGDDQLPRAKKTHNQQAKAAVPKPPAHGPRLEHQHQ